MHIILQARVVLTLQELNCCSMEARLSQERVQATYIKLEPKYSY